ncbi:hypothetical protein L1049_018100 [Liquidambar formosana]|uniref:Uncharacterized protein n=1 Tax=Liquidambar formosana TaxID=63359 RepID=A0AAP0NIK9_LIQFO
MDYSLSGVTDFRLLAQENCQLLSNKDKATTKCMVSPKAAFVLKKCCAKCLCVPPGTYGNKQVCPCYNNWKTKRGGPKCP